MLKYKKIFLSLCLCLILLTVSVFATTMTESEIKNNVNSGLTELYSAYSENNYTTYTLLDSQKSTLYSYFLEHVNNTLSDNYLYYFTAYDSDHYYLYYYDLGLSTVDRSMYDFEEFPDGSVQVFFSDNVVCYELEYDEGFGYVTNQGNTGSLSFTSYVRPTVSGNTFDTVFSYSSNNIFTEPDSIDSDIFAGILATMTFVLGSITTVMGALTQVDLILFVILASLTISLIYFVVKLLKGFTGNKLNTKKFKK